MDHCYSSGLGGSNDIKNLWAMPWDQAKQKDIAERLPWRLVCDHRMRLPMAQELLRRDWQAVYLQSLKRG